MKNQRERMWFWDDWAKAALVGANWMLLIAYLLIGCAPQQPPPVTVTVNVEIDGRVIRGAGKSETAAAVKDEKGQTAGAVIVPKEDVPPAPKLVPYFQGYHVLVRYNGDQCKRGGNYGLETAYVPKAVQVVQTKLREQGAILVSDAGDAQPPNSLLLAVCLWNVAGFAHNNGDAIVEVRAVVGSLVVSAGMGEATYCNPYSAQTCYVLQPLLAFENAANQAMDDLIRALGKRPQRTT